jgi:hypothetical protein
METRPKRGALVAGVRPAIVAGLSKVMGGARCVQVGCSSLAVVVDGQTGEARCLPCAAMARQERRCRLERRTR